MMNQAALNRIFLAVMAAIVAMAMVATAKPATAAPERGLAFTCIAVAVWDGDGPIRCRDGGKVRLSGINAREIDGTCRAGHPCPSAGAIRARDILVKLLGGATGTLRDGHVTIRPVALRCEITGGSYDRITAFCRLQDGRDLSCAMLASGTVAKWPRYWGKHRCAR
jgi:endonuclease YncB( thermonuclease family)